MLNVAPGYITVGQVVNDGFYDNGDPVVSVDRIKVRVLEFDGVDPNSVIGQTLSKLGNVAADSRSDDELPWASILVPAGKSLNDRVNRSTRYYNVGDLVYVTYPSGNASAPLVLGVKYTGTDADYPLTNTSVFSETSDFVSDKRVSTADCSVVVPPNFTAGYPLDGTYPITSKFGYRSAPVAGASTYHQGLDFGVPTGVGIKSILYGVVKTVEHNHVANGNNVIVNHGTLDGHEISSRYKHMSEIKSTEGQIVSQGQVIGLVGSTGYSTGPHLHFEIRIDGKPVNPLYYNSHFVPRLDTKSNVALTYELYGNAT